MKPVLYAALVLGVVPLQVTVLHDLGLGIHPDLCLVAATLVGLLGGPLEGIVIGVALGVTQDLLSANTLWLNVVSKGVIGLLAGVAGRQVTNATPAMSLVALGGVSIVSGFLFLFSVRGGVDLGERLSAAVFVLLPETLMNVVLGAALYWVLPIRPLGEGMVERGPIELVE